MDRYYYKNRSSTLQTLNTNSGRSLYVQPQEEVQLEEGEHTSVEIVRKTEGNRPTGALRKETVQETVTPAEPVEQVPQQPEENVIPAENEVKHG